MVSQAGASFKNITLHNLKYYKDAKKVEWNSKENYSSLHSFVLDTRIW